MSWTKNLRQRLSQSVY